MKEYWGTAAAGSIIIAADSTKFLLIHRSPHVYEPNTWSCTIGGKLESTEDSRIAAIREIREETEYHNKLFTTMRPVHVYKDGDFRYFTYITIVPNEIKLIMNWETQDFRWINFGNPIPSPLHFGTKQLLPKLKRWYQLGFVQELINQSGLSEE